MLWFVGIILLNIDWYATKISQHSTHHVICQCLTGMRSFWAKSERHRLVNFHGYGMIFLTNKGWTTLNYHTGNHESHSVMSVFLSQHITTLLTKKHNTLGYTTWKSFNVSEKVKRPIQLDQRLIRKLRANEKVVTAFSELMNSAWGKHIFNVVSFCVTSCYRKLNAEFLQNEEFTGAEGLTLLPRWI